MQTTVDEKTMTPVRAAFLSLFMLSGIVLWGAGIYSADAAGEHVVIDGYGVSPNMD
ncbi:MAG: hypothetical protein ACK4F5_15430 [Aliihoeflea sp.]|jgi:hypothetical membrane protein